MSALTLKQRVASCVQAIQASWDRDVARLTRTYALAAEAVAGANVSSQDLWLLDAVLARGGGVREICKVFVPPLEDQIRRAEQKHPHALANLEILNFANMLQCLGLEPDPSLMATAAQWLIGINTAGEEPPWYHWQRGMAGLVFGQPRVYRPVCGYGLDDALVFDPHADPQFNMQGWLSQLAAGVEAGVSYDAVKPLWLRFLDVYETLSEVEALYDSDIFWVARIVRNTIGGAPLGTVAAWMQRSIWQFAGLV